MSKTQIELPPKLIPLFSEQGLRYRVSKGGRGSGKTRTFALMTAIRAYMAAEQGQSGVILSAREHLNSLADSSMEEIKQAIRAVPFLDGYFEMGENYIRTRNRLVSYVFAGLRHNLDSIKSKARILIAWVDEAETVGEIAWQKLLPTVREDESEVWVTYNPERRDSPTNKRFGNPEIIDDDTGQVIGRCVIMNYSDNPWFPHVLELERRQDKKNLSPEKYDWIWGGAYLEMSEAVVFKGKFEVQDFTPDLRRWNGPYQGLDFGFANDPTAGVQCFINANILYIYRDFSKVELELDDTARYALHHIPDFDKYPIIADNARPESISHLKRKGLPRIEACKKGKGSVEDGIAYIQSFDKVIIHPSCTATIQEFKTYSYKTDKLTGEVIPILLDENNHNLDALRYSLEKARRGASMLDAM